MARSRGFADIIFTLCGINSQPEKQRKTPHEDHVRQSYSCTIYLFTHRSYFLPLLVRDLLCWPKIRFPPWPGIYGSAALTVTKKSQPPSPDRTRSCLQLASVPPAAPRLNTSAGHLQGRAVVISPWNSKVRAEAGRLSKAGGISQAGGSILCPPSALKVWYLLDVAAGRTSSISRNSLGLYYLQATQTPSGKQVPC